MVDLGDHFNKKQSVDQVTSHCQCEQIVTYVLADCSWSSPALAKSVFECLSNFSSSKLAKQLRFSDKDAPFNGGYPEDSISMAERDIGKPPAPEPQNSIIGVYMGTLSRFGAVHPVLTIEL